MRKLVVFWLLAGLIHSKADISSDYAALTAGLTTVPGSGGTPGTVVLHGRTAFPVFAGNTNGTEAVVAAGHWNDNTNSGRGIAYSHTGWTSTTGNSGMALSNAVRWAARGKANAVVGLGSGMPAANWFTAQGYTTKSLSTTMNSTSDDFTGVDVALISMHSGYSSNALSKAMAFLANGGGILVFSTPWALSSTAFADANNLLVNLGLTFSGDYGSGGPFTVSTTPYSSYVSALIGLDLLLAQRTGTTNVSVAIQQSAADGIDGVLAVRPLFPPLTNGLAQLLATYGGFISINANRTLTKASVPIEALCERYQSGLFDRTPATQLPKHPDADDFPGAVAVGAPVVNKTVLVHGNAPPDDPAFINQGSHGTRQPVGLYARAGTVVRVRIPADKTAAGLRIQIGHHHDVNFNIDSWHRHPKVARYEPLTNVVNEIGSPYGGLILVRVPPDSLLGDFPITIEGAVEAPHFEQGVHSSIDWTRLQSLPGAQGYICASNFTAYVSREALQGVTDAQHVADFWGTIIKTGDYYTGYLNRFREEAAKTDRDIVAGGGHAGYPFVMAYGRDDDELVNGVMSNGDWGFYHELGHAYQDNGHGWNGTGGVEVDVNVIPNLLMTLIHKRSLWDNNTHGTMDAPDRAAARAAFFATPLAQRSWFDVNGGNVVGYDFYFNLPESFGYDLWHRAFSRFYRWSTNNASEPSFAGLDRYNRWFVGMCEESGYNLAPYFENYGWTNITPAVKSRFAALPAWSSNRPPTSFSVPASSTIGEAAPAGTLLGTCSTTDPDPGNLFIYSILSGNEDGAFTLDRWSGELRVASLDYERKSNYVLTFTVFDNALPRYFLTNTLSITVTNTGEPPRIVAPLLRAISHTPAGTVLGTVGAVADTGRTITSFAHIGGSSVFGIHPTSGVVTQTQAAPGINGGVLAFTVRVTDNTGAFNDAEVLVLFNSPTGLREQRWNGAAATGSPAFEGLTTNWPSANTGDNYVRRLTAWLVPPRTGAYTFWVTGSDRASFHLGTNASPVSRAMLCTGASTGVGNFDAAPGQRSPLVWLEAGKAYSLEVFQTEVTGSDYAQAAWQGPGIAARELIPASVLIPGSDVFFPPGGGTGPVAGVALSIGQNDNGGTLTFAPPLGVEVDAILSGDITAVTNVQFFVNGALSFSDDAPPFYNFWTANAPGFYTLHAVARDQHGNVVTSPLRVVSLLQSVTMNVIVASNAVWRYFDKGQDLGTNWRVPAYDDSGWSNGAARLGFGGQGETTTVNGGPSSARYWTTYFRRVINITNLARYAGFTLGVARDDGAVVYVNGVEVFRTGMNPGTVSYSTTAINATDVQTFFTTNLPPSVFSEGTNVVAVEVHQSSATSGDLGFALKLDGVFTLPVFSAVITDQAPGATLVLPGGPVLGGWGVRAEATTPNGSITSVVLRVDGAVETNPYGTNLLFFYRAAGTYTLDVVARNSAGQSVTSAPVVVSVITNAPPGVAITYPGFFQNLLATNTILLRANASDSDGTIASVEMILDDVSLGVLHRPPFTWLWQPVVGSHQLHARAIDNTGGTRSAGIDFTVSAGPIVTNLTLVSSNSAWKYNDEGVSLGTAWTNATYNDLNWSNGITRIGFGSDGETTPIRGQPRITYYFRKQFFVPEGFGGTNVTVKLSRDDGAVVYLNGMEIVRDNMPGGLITYSTRPGNTVSGPDEQAYFVYVTNAAALRVGANTIAAEVHQIDGSSTDVGFNLELTSSGTQTVVSNPPPELNLLSLSPTELRIFFPDVNGLAYAVEGSTNLPTWFPLMTNVVSGGMFQFVTNPTNSPAQFFRVRRLLSAE